MIKSADLRALKINRRSLVSGHRLYGTECQRAYCHGILLVCDVFSNPGMSLNLEYLRGQVWQYTAFRAGWRGYLAWPGPDVRERSAGNWAGTTLYRASIPFRGSYRYRIMRDRFYLSGIMPTIPACPLCSMENTYQDGDNTICADCGHEWPMNATSRG